MIRFEYKEPYNTDIFGTIKVSVGGEVSYNFPLNFVFYRKIDNRVLWQSKLDAPGYWAAYSETCNGYARVFDVNNQLVASWDWETILHGDDIHKYFYNWCCNNKGSKGIAIGTHDGTTGEWVEPLSEGLIEGVLVEASELQYNSLFNNFKDYKNVQTLQSLVTPNGGTCDFYEGNFGYVNSVFKSHVSQFAADENEIRTVTKESISLNDLIIKFGLEKDLKWLHLDVEGIDDELILSLDDTRVKLPEIIIYESLNLSEERKRRVIEWLKSKDYFCKEIGWNTYALKTHNDLSLVVHTHDAYERFWAGMFYTLDFYWEYDNFKTYFANEEKKISDIELNCKGIICRPNSRIKQILTGKTADKYGFSTRLIKAIEQVPSKYILYIQEDMWLRRGLDKELLDELVNFMEVNNANSVKIHAKIHFYDYKLEPTEHIIKGLRMCRQDTNSLMSHNATIWRKDYLLKYQKEGEDPWKNEDNGTIRMKDEYKDSYHYNIHWYCQPGISDSGIPSPEFGVYAPIVDEMKNIELKLKLRSND
jgi:hypothetical protein